MPKQAWRLTDTDAATGAMSGRVRNVANIQAVCARAAAQRISMMAICVTNERGHAAAYLLYFID